MTLIKSISGIRGTIGGVPGEGLSPVDVVKFTAGYAQWRRASSQAEKLTVVVGRDARLSGAMINSLVCSTLTAMGCDVVDLGRATTPTVEMAVTAENAQGGIIITASHNPGNWNALKLLNERGEFLSGADGEAVLAFAEAGWFTFAAVDGLGMVAGKDYLQHHIDKISELNLVDVDAIRRAGFTVAFDAVNSVGGIALPPLLKALGVKEVVPINGEPTGRFAHTPEPLPENLRDTCAIVRELPVDVCFVVDPDVDRLSIISEDGSMFNEEYTLVAVADYILSHTPGNTVSNLSSSRALKDVTEKYGCSYFAAAVGEVNVVTKMKETGAVIGGEGNGGVIYPALHHGRDALVGIALFLSLLARSGKTCSELRKSYPDYFIAKKKIELTPETDGDVVFEKIKKIYSNELITDIDGVKIDFDDEWVHLRKSNTEPVIRVYAESVTADRADMLAGRLMKDISSAATGGV